MIIQPEPPVLVSLAHTAGPTTRVSPKVTEGLLAFDLDFKPRPQLATSWSVSPDGLRYRFGLRENVRWHDGQPFTSADVAHSIGLLKQHHPRGRGAFASVTEVLTPDPLTAEIVLSRPAPYLLAALTASESPIVPKHVYGSRAATSCSSATRTTGIPASRTSTGSSSDSSQTPRPGQSRWRPARSCSRRTPRCRSASSRR